MLEAPAELDSGRGSAVVAASGPEGEDVSDSGAIDEAVELPQSMAAGEVLAVEGTSDVGTLGISLTQHENAAEIATPQPSTSGVLQHKLSKNSMAVPSLQGAGVDCILDDPAQTSNILIETVVAKYLHLAVAGAVAVVVAVPKVDTSAPDEVPGNPLLRPCLLYTSPSPRD